MQGQGLVCCALQGQGLVCCAGAAAVKATGHQHTPTLPARTPVPAGHPGLQQGRSSAPSGPGLPRLLCWHLRGT